MVRVEKHLASQAGEACSPGQWVPGGSRWVGPGRLHPSEALQAADLWVSSSKFSRLLLLPLLWGPFLPIMSLGPLSPERIHTPQQRLDQRPVVMAGACLGRAAPLPLTAQLGFRGLEKGRERIFTEHLLCARYYGPFPRSDFPSLLPNPPVTGGTSPT